MKNIWILTMLPILVLHLSANQALAQFDFDVPPPPGSEGSSDPSSGGTAGSGAAGTSGLLTKAQKEKFNKSGSEDITDENFPELIESFDFPNAEITDVIKAISELTGKNFIIDPGVRGKITIVAPSRISVAEAYRAFLSALATNGFTVVPSGKFLKVKTSRNAQRDSIETFSGDYFPNSDQMITRIIHLKHISAEQVNRDLRILPSKDGEMSVYPPTNSIILSDYGSNIERVMRIISQLDVPGFEEQLEVMPVKHAKSKDLADLIDQIVNRGEGGGSRGRAGAIQSGVPRFTRNSSTPGRSGGSSTASFMVIPDDRTNALIIVGNKAGIDRVKKLVKQLDFRLQPGEGGGVWVYYVKYGDAEKIATTLSGIAKEASPRGGAAAGGGGGFGGFGGPAMGAPATQNEIFGGEVKITADKTTNALIVTAAKQDYETVLNLLSKIDIARDQVYVEAVIMEMVLSDGDLRAAGYFQFDGKSKGVGRAGFNGFGQAGTPSLTDMLNPTGGSGAILGFGSSKTVTIKVGEKDVVVPSLLGFFNLLSSMGRTNVLSTPQIMALDNEQATIEVGDRVPVGTASSTANGVTTTGETKYEDANLTLKIKPFISPSSDSIRMEIGQKIKSLSQKTIPGGDNKPSFSNRSLETNIVVNDRDTAVLGGLIKDEEREAMTKVPILGDIPILGWLFSSRLVQKEKVNLLVFLTPKIIRTNADNQQLLGHKLDERLEFVKKAGGRDPYGSTIDKLPRRADATPLPEAGKMDPITRPNTPDEVPAPETETITPPEDGALDMEIEESSQQ